MRVEPSPHYEFLCTVAGCDPPFLGGLSKHSITNGAVAHPQVLLDVVVTHATCAMEEIFGVAAVFPKETVRGLLLHWHDRILVTVVLPH